MLLELKKKQQSQLPHLYGIEKYKWQVQYWESVNRYNFLTAANQIGKSSIQICKCIHWATEPELWPELWRTKPTQFWYFYTDATQATVEFHEKWVKEFLPSGEMKKHPQYGWEAEYDQRKKIFAVHFNSGVSVYFKTYEQNVHSLQASTVYAIFADEEMPKHLFDEVNVRLIATSGYFHMVFTATRGQEFWRLTIEPLPSEMPNFPDAFKLQVSMYDCLFYANGAPSKWTVEYIKEIERSCSSPQEVLRRVYGKFVKSTGLLVKSFRRDKHTTRNLHIPPDWIWYSGVDAGNGGGEGHPPGLVFLAVNQEYTRGKIFQCFRGDDEVMSSAELLMKYQSMKAGRKMRGQKYDYGGIGKDFGIIADRAGEGMLPAKKDRTLGFGILNDLFSLDMLEVVLLDEHSEKLCTELTTASESDDKTKAKDDLIDALRYAVVDIPWVMIKSATKIEEPTPIQKPIKSRFENHESRPRGVDLLIDEFEEWNEDCEYLGY